jgi:hypothetical protein
MHSEKFSRTGKVTDICYLSLSYLLVAALPAGAGLAMKKMLRVYVLFVFYI